MTDPADDPMASAAPATDAARERPRALGARPSWIAQHTPLVLGLVGLAGLVAINVALLAAQGSPQPTAASAPSAASAAVSASATGSSPAAAPAANAAPDDRGDDPDEHAGRDDRDGKRHEKAAHKAKAPGTVRQAATESCSTASVEGLSRQIIAQARCIDPNAFVAMPPNPNLVTGSHVFLYLEASARDRLVRTLGEHRDWTMTVNSALRTVAQQYLVWRWSAHQRCGVKLATPPGGSNHETGLALDIVEADKWRPALEAQDFRWLGPSDRVHFDYTGARAAARPVDVMAFQQLWNRNHPDDAIPEHGRYDAATEARLEKSPAAGFPLGARCRPAAR